jgi:hypothetical protein
MQTETIVGAAAFAAALLALAVYHVAVVRGAFARVEALVSAHDQLLGGSSGRAAARLSSLEEGQSALASRAERAESRLGELEALSRTDVSRVGFVRFDAFEDTGSELSYALALLNREGDGIVLSSIYSRTDTRTYGKAVERFVPRTNALPEELAAIERARDLPERR